MNKYILHGGFERQNNEFNQSFYRELTQDLSDGATLLLVYFASEYEEVREAFTEQTNRIREITGKDLRFVLATEEDFMSQVKQADAVHFRGGNTTKLLAILKQYSELVPVLKEKKIISGSSAGAYALAKYGTAHSEEHVREGLGIVPVRIVCHYESDELPPSLQSYEELLDMAPELELVHLRDCEWRIFEQ